MLSIKHVISRNILNGRLGITAWPRVVHGKEPQRGSTFRSGHIYIMVPNFIWIMSCLQDREMALRLTRPPSTRFSGKDLDEKKYKRTIFKIYKDTN
jgi:hypothetical protein